MSQKPGYLFASASIHPYLFGAFSVLSLIGHNIVEIAPIDGLRALLLSLTLVGGAHLITRRATGWSWGRSGLAASLFAILFFSYGHLYSLVEGAVIGSFLAGRHVMLGLLYLFFGILGIRVIRTLRDTGVWTQTLNLVGAALLVVPIFQIGTHQYILRTSGDAQGGLDLVQQTSVVPEQPDVYYIILDAYTRDDTLLDLYGFDNRPFLEQLEQRGFYSPLCSRSNYARTFLSLSSSLNMDYVQELSMTNDHAEFTALIKDNAVRRKFASLGYSIVAFDAGYFRTQWPDADQWFSYKSGGEALRSLSEIEALYIETTALIFVLDANAVLGGSPLDAFYESTKLERFNRVNYIFDTLETVVDGHGPKFVFVHVPSPHSPYIFAADGRFRPDPESLFTGYRDQVAYLNDRVLPIIDTILETEGPAPIIIIQGDHGAGETKPDFRRLNILNTYFLPGDAQAQLYPSITPVNTFRLIFDSYFGEELGLLPDISYFSPVDQNLAFTVAPDSRPGCQDE